MKRLLSIVLAGIIGAGFVAGLSHNNSQAVKNALAKRYYYNSDRRNSCIDVMAELLKDDTIAVMGSSELSAADENAYPRSLYNDGNSDFNMILMGRGYTQSLHHAIDVAALGNFIPSHKVVLILSPQWFTEEGIGETEFASRFLERSFSTAIKNPGLSYEIKRRICDRVEQLLRNSDPEQYKRVLMYDRVYVERKVAPVDSLYLFFWDLLMENKNKSMLVEEVEELEEIPHTKEQVKAGAVDYGELMEKAVLQGEKECTNNVFYIYDDYFMKYVMPQLSTSGGGSFSNSVEYSDLELFLDVCGELDIKPLIVSMPVNGLWYDWINFPAGEREIYYQKVRDLCQSKDVQMLDFSQKDYEPYFLKDVMHCGWKGWVYLDEGIYRYHLDNDKVVQYPFPVTASVIRARNECYVKVKDRISDVREATLTADNVTLKMKVGPDGFLDSIKVPSDFSLEGQVRLEISGVNGAGCIAQVSVQTDEYFLWKNSYTSGTARNGKDGFDFITQIPDNSFSYLTFQLYDGESGEFIMNFGQSDGKKYVAGDYVHELESGNYRLVMKANSIKADELVFSNEYFEKGETYHYIYTVDEMSQKRISTKNVKFWHTVEEQR